LKEELINAMDVRLLQQNVEAKLSNELSCACFNRMRNGNQADLGGRLKNELLKTAISETTDEMMKHLEKQHNDWKRHTGLVIVTTKVH